MTNPVTTTEAIPSRTVASACRNSPGGMPNIARTVTIFPK